MSLLFWWCERLYEYFFITEECYFKMVFPILKCELYCLTSGIMSLISPSIFCQEIKITKYNQMWPWTLDAVSWCEYSWYHHPGFGWRIREVYAYILMYKYNTMDEVNVASHWVKTEARRGNVNVVNKQGIQHFLVSAVWMSFYRAFGATILPSKVIKHNWSQ